MRDAALDALRARVEAHFEAQAATVQRDSAHDLAHVARVARHAGALAVEAGADVRVCVAAAWLHDLEWLPKNHPEASLCAARSARLIPALLADVGLAALTEAVVQAVEEHPFSVGRAPSTLEAAILQDADRLDAIGAIGVARCFATGGSFGGALWHAGDPFAESGRPLDDKAFSLDHFERKLLRLAGAMNTPAGRRRAAALHATMQGFVEALRAELSVD